MTFFNLLRIPGNTTLMLDTGAVTSAAGDGIDARAGTLWLDTGGAVGAAGNPLTTHVANLRGTADGGLFLRENDGVLNQLTISEALGAGADTIHLVGGTFLLGGSDRLDDNSRLNVDGATLDLVTRNDTVHGVTLTNGQITGSGLLTSATTFQVYNGVIAARLAGSVGLDKTTSGTVALNNSNLYTGPTTAVHDGDGDGLADAIYAVQGPVGTTGEIHRFDVLGTLPFSYQPAAAVTGFFGPWFIATTKTPVSVSDVPIDNRGASASRLDEFRRAA